MDTYASLLKLRFHPLYKDGFVSDQITHSLGGAFKWLQVTTDTSNLCLVGNFDVATATGQVSFQNAGTWYDYLNGTTFTATGAAQSITLQPGEFHLYLNRNVTNVITTPVTDILNQGKFFSISVYPNPVMKNAVLEIENKETGSASLELFNAAGQKIKERSLGVLVKGVHQISFTEIDKAFLPSGIYLIQCTCKK